MKKILLIFTLIGFLTAGLSSCNKENTKSYCWDFTITVSYSGTGSELLNGSTNNIQQCSLTEAQAEMVRKGLESSYTVGGLTTKTTATKKRQ